MGALRLFPHTLPHASLPPECSLIYYTILLWIGKCKWFPELSQIIKPKRESWELQLTASHSEANNVELGTGIWSRVLWDWALTLSDGRLTPCRQCQNWVELQDTQLVLWKLLGGKIITTHVVIRSVRSMMCVCKGKHRNVFPDSSQYFSCPINLLLHSHVLCQSKQFSLPRHYLKNTYFTKTLSRTLILEVEEK